MTDAFDAPEDLAIGDVQASDAAHFRAVLGHFCTGIAVVAGVESGVPFGLTCQSIVSLSLSPRLVAFSPSKLSSSWPRIHASGCFCINILTEDQEEISRVFATPGADKYRGVGWRPAKTGSPVLNDVLAWVDCRLVDQHDAGDHWIVVGEVVDLDAGSKGRPLLTYRGGYGRFEA